MSNVTSFQPTLTYEDASLTPNNTSAPPNSTAERTTLLATVLSKEIHTSGSTDSILPDNTDHELITVVWVTTAIVVGVGIFIMALVAVSHAAHLCRRRKNKCYLHDGGARQEVTENHVPENALTLHSITINAEELRDVDTGSVSMAPFVLKPQDNPGYEIDCDENWSKSNNRNHHPNSASKNTKSRDREKRKTSTNEKPRKLSHGAKDRESARKGEKRDGYTKQSQYPQGTKLKKPIERSKEVRADPNFQFDSRHYYERTNSADRNNTASTRLLRDPMRF
ncbi:uncharacterized protein LOC135497844 [Lineus longissimus]|uniref:uncharacterized protein LOC135497844 n=1 Tax=Lineus longissimus TaxID=88925 RepID=UPI002B4C2A44